MTEELRAANLAGFAEGLKIGKDSGFHEGWEKGYIAGRIQQEEVRESLSHLKESNG